MLRDIIIITQKVKKIKYKIISFNNSIRISYYDDEIFEEYYDEDETLERAEPEPEPAMPEADVLPKVMTTSAHVQLFRSKFHHTDGLRQSMENYDGSKILRMLEKNLTADAHRSTINYFIILFVIIVLIVRVILYYFQRNLLYIFANKIYLH